MITIRSQAPSCPRESEARRRTMSTIATIHAMVATTPRSQSQSTVELYGLGEEPSVRPHRVGGPGVEGGLPSRQESRASRCLYEVRHAQADDARYKREAAEDAEGAVSAFRLGDRFGDVAFDLTAKLLEAPGLDVRESSFERPERFLR